LHAGLTNPSWHEALARYDSLVGAGWEHIPGFRALVLDLGSSAEAAGLTAVTSQDALVISPYTCAPDWFEGRHVRLRPLIDGGVRIDWHPEEGPVEIWTVPLAEAKGAVLPLLTEL
jgi:hypothetical protein